MMARRTRPEDGRTGGGATGLPVIGVAALAVACCGAGPLLVAAASSLALATVVGAGACVMALSALTALAVVRTRRRRGCAPTPPSTRKTRPS